MREQGSSWERWVAFAIGDLLHLPTMGYRLAQSLEKLAASVVTRA